MNALQAGGEVALAVLGTQHVLARHDADKHAVLDDRQPADAAPGHELLELRHVGGRVRPG